MLISPIIINKVLYVNLHAEQSFYGTFNADNLEISKNLITGIYVEELNLTVLDNVLKYVKKNKKYFDVLVLEFQKLITAQKNLDGKLIELKNEIKFTILKNINSVIIERLNLNTYINYFGNKPKANFYATFLLNEETDEKLKLVNEIKSVFDNEFKVKLDIITTKNKIKKIHHSSSVYLSNFIDVKQLIVNYKSLFYYSCYWLAIEMITRNPKRNWVIEKGSKTTLLCQNLNSSHLASILSSYLLLDIITLDHIGPINKVYNEIDKKINHGEEYIVVSDVVCLGTEVRIAKNIIEFSGGKYLGNVSVVRIMTMKLEERYPDTASVFEITKSNNPINFKITTALD